MAQAVTFGDVWEMFQEMVREDRERRVELDRKFQETDRQMKESDRKFQEMVREDRERRVELDRKFQETDRQMKETDLKVKETTTLISQLGGRWGDFVEGLVAPACKTLFAQRNIPVHKVSRRVEADLPGCRRMEIDVLVVNTDAVVLVEVKSKLTTDDVRAHLKRLAEFKEFFPEYAAKRTMGAVAGIVVEENVNLFAIKKGLFVIVQSGNTVHLANEEAFAHGERLFKLY